LRIMNGLNIVVFGLNGQVGWNLRRTLACLGNVIAVGPPDVDFRNHDSVIAILRQSKPAVIVNAAAYTAVDECEAREDIAFAVNATAAGIIAEEAKRQKSLLVHYSSDYVFDGKKPESYQETDAPNPLNVYGRTKLAGDVAVQAAGGEYIVFRTSWVYGARGKNFLLTILRLARERSELRIVSDQIGAPTSSGFIAQATAAVLAQMLLPNGLGRLDGRNGIYNLTNSGATSWCGFAEASLRAAATRMGMSMPKLVPVPSSEHPSPAARPANSRLCGGKIESVFGIHAPHWTESLALVIDEIAERAAALPDAAAFVSQGSDRT
jgi:dTDP-4-dehydrorhamnose reductase